MYRFREQINGDTISILCLVKNNLNPADTLKMRSLITCFLISNKQTRRSD